MSKATYLWLGRARGYAYVSDSYRRDLRSDPKYKRWGRALARATYREMSPSEKHILGVMLEHRATVLQESTR